MKDLLKFMTCGSVDDGKSTLIGRLLYDAKLLFADQERALELESKIGSRGGKIDYSLLLDGLLAEREQGITIDVAYRYFSTERRSFIVADTPGHEQYTRNMAVGASFAQLAIILVDATRGISLQTKRHARICSLFGIRHLVLAVNKMDLMNYREDVFEAIRTDFSVVCSGLVIESIQAIPVSATEGDNIMHRSRSIPWYRGPAILEYLEEVDVQRQVETRGFLMPVQRATRPHHAFRGFQGHVEAGRIGIGDEVTVLPSKERATVRSILIGDRESEVAEAGQPVTIQLAREVDISRGCVLVNDRHLEVADRCKVAMLWMDNDKLIPGQQYLAKVGTKLLPVVITEIDHKIDINTGAKVPAEGLGKNDLAVCDLAFSEPVVFDSFESSPGVGACIIIDRLTNMTAGCGIIQHALRGATHVHRQETSVTPQMRAALKGHQALTVWFTGLSGSGKSTLANELERRLVALGKHTVLIDGDNVRHGLNKDLGFSETDREENIRRVAEVARLMNDAGLIVIASFISPYKRDRVGARETIGDRFVEVFLSTPLEACELRDVKGLYQKARAGKIPNFTGIASPYERPDQAEVEIDTSECTVESATETILRVVLRRIALE